MRRRSGSEPATARSALTFRIVLASIGLVLWGQVRPRSGAQTYRVQVRTGGAWRFSGGSRRTSVRGFFSTPVAAPEGASVRIYSPQDDAYSATIRVR